MFPSVFLTYPVPSFLIIITPFLFQALPQGKHHLFLFNLKFVEDVCKTIINKDYLPEGFWTTISKIQLKLKSEHDVQIAFTNCQIALKQLLRQ